MDGTDTISSARAFCVENRFDIILARISPDAWMIDRNVHGAAQERNAIKEEDSRRENAVVIGIGTDVGQVHWTC